MKSKKITSIGLLVALSMVAGYFIHFPILPQAPFLLYDPGSVFLLIGSFKLGPKIGLIMSFLTATLFALITGQGGPYGALMNFIATGTLVFVAAKIYFLNHSKKGAILGIIFGSLAMTLIMIPANLIITPLYLGVGRDIVIKMLLSAIIPFNLIKGMISGLITLIIYKKLYPLIIAK
ncbi:MAG: ECF transporter S component [Candidatus Caldatribacteriota bacterium]|nr:ECF transporter S component [Candidatus Caldatribacteriota bacterium]